MTNFDLDRSVRQWLKSFRKFRAFNHGSVREMEVHLRDHIYDLMAAGKSEEEAFNEAVKAFGDIPSMAKEEYWTIKRKTTFNALLNTTMINTYFKVAIRNFWKNKFYATVNIVGLTVGLAVVFLIALFVRDELSFDQFHTKYDRLYRVVENQYYADQPVFPVAVTPTSLGPALETKYPEVLSSARVYFDSYQFKLGDKTIMESNGITADAQFFDLFTYPVVSGSLESFKDDINALVLTEKLAAKYFPDKNPVGESITLSDEQFVVRAVINDPPPNTHLPFDFVVNFQHYLAGDSGRANNWGSNWLYTYVELAPQTKLEAFNDKIKGLIKENNENSVTDIYLQPFNDIYLGEVDFTVEAPRKGQMIYVKIFSIVAFFILIISCINFMNLSTARSVKRAKEVGLRKTVGASRTQLILQFLSESVLLSLFAVVMAVFIVILLLPFFNQITNKEFFLADLMDPVLGLKLALGVTGAALFTGLIAGSYPAVFLSSVQPVLILNNQGITIKQGSLLRKVLVVLQFSISVILIVGTFVIYQQLNFIQDVNLGYNKQNIAYTYASQEKAPVIADALRDRKGIVNVGLSNRHPGYVLSSSSGFSWPGKDPDETILMHYMGIDENYIPTMEMNIVEGRGFVHTDSIVVIINERAKELMGLEDPVGQLITGQSDYRIVGVVSDFNFKSIHTRIEPIIIFKSGTPNRLYIRYEDHKEAEVKQTVEEVWSDFFPDREFHLFFLDKDFNEMYAAEQRTTQLSTYFAVIAIIISCLGLFGLVSYATEQRNKEIGIRKVLGASVPKIFLLLTYDFTRLVLISLLIALPIGWFAMSEWLEGFAYRIDLSIATFVFAGVIAVLIALLTVTYQSVKASVSNPVKALRTE